MIKNKNFINFLNVKTVPLKKNNNLSKKHYLFNSLFFNKFLNLLILKGKKFQIEKKVLKLIYIFKENFYFIFSILIFKIIIKLTIFLKLVKKVIAGKPYYFPAPIYFFRRYVSAFYFFLQELFKKYYRNYVKSFLIYFFEFIFKRNLLFLKNKVELYKQATEHSINVHFRWEI